MANALDLVDFRPLKRFSAGQPDVVIGLIAPLMGGGPPEIHKSCSAGQPGVENVSAYGFSRAAKIKSSGGRLCVLYFQYAALSLRFGRANH
jgi:hypothetical protein